MKNPDTRKRIRKKTIQTTVKNPVAAAGREKSRSGGCSLGEDRKQMRREKISPDTAEGEEKTKKHVWTGFGDYSPRYEGAFDIYEKARKHVKEVRKKEENPE